MCARFTRHYSWAEIRDFLALLGPPRNLQARYNIAPTTDIDVLRLDAEGARELVRMRWGLVPYFWGKPLKELPATFNARAETVDQKPMFREALKRRRCIVPASGFYEWTGGKGAKIPHLFTAGDGSPLLGFAGLWESWRDRDTDERVQSATVIVSGASEWMQPYHDRMPVLLAPSQFGPWLDGSAGVELLRPAAEEALREWIVTTELNRPGQGDDDPAMIERAA